MNNIEYGNFIKRAEKYYDFAYDAFNWLFNFMYNSETNQHINVSLYIDPEERFDNGYRAFGRYYTGVVTIYLYNIISMNFNINKTRFMIITVLVHELFHSNQNNFIDNKHITSSKRDETYPFRFKFIEHPVINNTIDFLTKNHDIICDTFNIAYGEKMIEGFNLPQSVYMLNTKYNSYSPDVYWADIVREILGENCLDEAVLNLIRSNENIILSVDYYNLRDFIDDSIFIKMKGEYYSPSDELLYNIQRLRPINYSFKFKGYAKDDMKVLKIEVNPDLFKPIKRIEEQLL